MPDEDRIRGFAAGGDEAHLAHYTTAHPVGGTIVRRDENGFLRGTGAQILEGFLQLGNDVLLSFPLTDPPPDAVLGHLADGQLVWVEVGGLGGNGEELPVDWVRVYNTPQSLAGYGILDAYTKTEIESKRVEDEALMRFVAG